MSNDDRPATTRELNAGLQSLGTELRGEMRAMEQRLESKIATTVATAAKDIVRELSGVIQPALGIADENAQRSFRTIDEKYQDLPGRVTVLERDVADLKAGPPTPPAATRRRKLSR